MPTRAQRRMLADRRDEPANCLPLTGLSTPEYPLAILMVLSFWPGTVPGLDSERHGRAAIEHIAGGGHASLCRASRPNRSVPTLAMELAGVNGTMRYQRNSKVSTLCILGT
jgi:hypothetical protein